MARPEALEEDRVQEEIREAMAKEVETKGAMVKEVETKGAMVKEVEMDPGELVELMDPKLILLSLQ